MKSPRPPICTGTDLTQPRLETGPTDNFVSLIDDGTVPAGAASVEFVAFPSKSEAGGELVAFFDDLFFETLSCATNATTLCLNGARFRVQALWTTPQGASGAGQRVQLTNDTGYFWFFNLANVEALVKVLNACSFPGAPRYWVFAAGLTNVRVELRVTDTQNGDTRVYVNPQSTPFKPIQDTQAFATCP